MPGYCILLRGINVGGRNKLSMSQLRDLLADIGCQSVSTYIQSGNVICQHPKTPAAELADKVKLAVLQELQLEIGVWAAEAPSFLATVEQNPFVEAAEQANQLHVFFCQQRLTSDHIQQEKLQNLLAPTERFQIIDSCLYLHAPAGIGRSKFASSVERVLEQDLTARNWRTIEKLCQMLQA